MKMFKFVAVEMDTGLKFTGSVMGKDKNDVIRETREWYAMELGTVIDQISVRIV